MPSTTPFILATSTARHLPSKVRRSVHHGVLASR
jgi:hypothetical protein